MSDEKATEAVRSLGGGLGVDGVMKVVGIPKLIPSGFIGRYHRVDANGGIRTVDPGCCFSLTKPKYNALLIQT
jgi:hypothetical protein